MSTFGKLYLVPENVVKRFLDRDKLLLSDQPLDAVEIDANNTVESTLKKTKIDEHSKQILHQQALGNYLTTREQRLNHYSVSQPESQPVVDPDTVLPQNTTEEHFPFLDTITATHREKAVNLLRTLKRGNRVTWDDKNKVLIDGKPIHGSNIVDLIKYSVGKSKIPPAGLQQFTKLVLEENYPKSLLSNPHFASTPQVM